MSEHDYPTRDEREAAEERIREVHEAVLEAHDGLFDIIARHGRIFKSDIQGLMLSEAGMIRLRLWLVQSGYIEIRGEWFHMEAVPK